MDAWICKGKTQVFVNNQSVSGRNKSMCGSSHMPCYQCMLLCMIHNSFALYGVDIIHGSRANKVECQ